MSSTGGPPTATPAQEPPPDPPPHPASALTPAQSPDPAPAEAPPGGPARIATDLRAALGPLTRRLRTVKPDGELTLSQTSALVLLDRDGPATASELAAREGIRPQSMCTIVGVLAERGLVSRAQDPHDGRRIVVSLTDSGRDGLHGARRERARRLTLAIGEELSPREQEQLAAAIPLLERITRRV
ncbi:MarR family winged helix-turn-helix transcriptional regulator [Streptomyces sp. NPDC087270]|uniref:MarR family winged helix-turn-helix transcriptional regulator n=1 Tax=Streptomyces sp. NPDC087270 TaxID=3365774 RepID=UPI0037F693A9